MFYIKLTADKELQVTEREHIYRGENLNEKLIFLIPEEVDDLSTDASLVYLSYVRADGGADVVFLDKMDDKYNETYFQYTLPITSRVTRFPGQISFFLQIFSGDPIDPQIVKTSECRLMVEDSRNMDEYFSDRFITALYQHDKRVSDEISRIDETLAENDELLTQHNDDIAISRMLISENREIIDGHTGDIAELRELVANKADSLIFNREDSTIQLTANGEPIGARIFINASNGKLISSVSMTTDGELVIFFDDDSFTNVGKIVGEDGKVYVPHVDSHKIMTFTIEDAAGEVPDPVDLNPDDEWSNVDEEQNQSDYFWEGM